MQRRDRDRPRGTAVECTIICIVMFCLINNTTSYFFTDNHQHSDQNCFCEVSLKWNVCTAAECVWCRGISLTWWFPFRSYLFQLQGSIDDCSCNVDTVDYFNNNKIFPRLKSLLDKDYFRFYKVNLRKSCPFWVDDSKCALKSCHVSTCDEEDIPEGLKGHHNDESPVYKVCCCCWFDILCKHDQPTRFLRVQ